QDSTSLTGTPPNLIIREDVEISLECITQHSIVKWSKDFLVFAIVIGTHGGICTLSGIPNPNFSYTCDSDNGIYRYLISTNVTVTSGLKNIRWECRPIVGIGGDAFYFNVFAMKSSATTSTSTIAINTEEQQGNQNKRKTNNRKGMIQWPSTDFRRWEIFDEDLDKILDKSLTGYVQRDIIKISSVSKIIYAEEQERFGVSNTKTRKGTQVPVSTITITPAGINNVTNAIVGETHTFMCTTGSIRPAAWIQWYIGGENVTNQALPQTPQLDGDKFISSSRLVYTGKDKDHNSNIHCEAFNIQGRTKVNSTEISIYVECEYVLSFIMVYNQNI
ncbi:Hypothetical predicted protein, partial [Mytilus galloprovincialis]